MMPVSISGVSERKSNVPKSWVINRSQLRTRVPQQIITCTVISVFSYPTSRPKHMITIMGSTEATLDTVCPGLVQCHSVQHYRRAAKRPYSYSGFRACTRNNKAIALALHGGRVRWSKSSKRNELAVVNHCNATDEVHMHEVEVSIGTPSPAVRPKADRSRDVEHQQLTWLTK